MRHILVTGAHRSGTTWTGNMIARSKDVFYIDEIFNPARDPGRCRIIFDTWFTHIPPGTEDPYLSALQETVIAHKYRLLAGLRTYTTLGVVKARIAEYWRNQMASRRTDLRSLLKDPIALFSAEWLAESLGMDVVVLVRHPAGFVSSLLKNDFYFPFEDLESQPLLMERFLEDFSDQIHFPPQRLIDQAILAWRIIYSVVQDYKEAHPSWLFIRYEDLAADPVAGFKDIFKKLDLPWDPAVEREIAMYSSPNNPVESDNSMAIKRNSKVLVRQWKNRLSNEEISLIKERTADVWPLYYQDDEW